MKILGLIRTTPGGKHAWYMAEINGSTMPVRKPITAELEGVPQYAGGEYKEFGTFVGGRNIEQTGRAVQMEIATSEKKEGFFDKIKRAVK